MTKAYKIARRVFFYSLFTLIILLSAGVLSLWLYGEEIKDQIIRSFNTTISTPVDVKSIELDAFKHFPYVTIMLGEVNVKESIALSEKSLLVAKSVDFTINPFSILSGDYSIHRIIVNDGALNLSVNRRNELNYRITKPKEGNSSASGGEMEINDFILNNVEISWDHAPRNQHFKFRTDKLQTQVELRDTTLLIGLKGDVQVFELGFGRSSYLTDKKFETVAELIYYNNSGRVSIQEGMLTINDSDFVVSGYFDPSRDGELNFELNGKNTTLQTLASFLPESLAGDLSKYRSEGDIFFKMNLEGRMNAEENPAIRADFGIRNGTITYPETGRKLVSVNLAGLYKSPSYADLSKTSLELNDISAVLDGRKLSGRVGITNFDDPRVNFAVDGHFDVSGLLSFFPQANMEHASGEVELDVEFAGRLKDLESLSTINRVSSEGQLSLSDVGFKSKDLTREFSNLNGALLFSKNVLAMEGLSGNFGSNHFELDGMVRNIFSFLLTDNQPLQLKATLTSKFIDFDELLSAKSDDSSGDYSLELSPLVDLEFNCRIDEIHFKRFSGQNLAGVLKIKDRLAMLQGIHFDEIGGRIDLEGLVDTKGETVEVLTRFSTRDIHVDSLFYLFEDFDQNFLVHSHLRGRLTSSVNAEMRFTKKLEFIPQSLVADMQAKIEKGELIGFEPLSELSAYIPDDSLLYLRFSELENEIHVENQTIYLPRMEVKSNVTAITIGGTHTFNHHINYKVVAPIVHTRRLDRDEDFAAIEDDGSSVPKIHLIIKGTTDDYVVTLDRSGVKNQLVTELKTEVKDLKNAFRKKQQTKQKELVLDEEDEFDWY